MLVRRAFAEASGGPVDEDFLANAYDFFLDYYRAHKLDFTYAYAGVLEALAALHKINKPPSGNAKIMAVLTNVQAVSGLIASGQGTVGKLINQDELYQSALSTVTNLNATAEDVRDAVNHGKSIIADISAGKGTIGKLVREEKLHEEVTTAATNLREILQKINQGKGAVGNLVNDQALLNDARLTLQKLDKATESLEDQGPLSVIGILASPLGF